MDHIQGLGFFGPLYHPGIDVHVWGPASSTLSLAARLTRYLSPPLFPVHLRDLPTVTCHDVPSHAFDIGPFRVETALVCHPNPTVGYRIHAEGGTVVYLPDHEPFLGLHNGRWLEPEWISGCDLATDADLLIHDAQYSEEEYSSRVGWGHSSYRHAFEFAARAGVRQFVPFHHDPSHDDDTLDLLVTKAVRLFEPDFVVSNGREGAVIEVDSKS
jgi:phosphoribosyl 1,2-cyclic phosphodiesterase